MTVVRVHIGLFFLWNRKLLLNRPQLRVEADRVKFKKFKFLLSFFPSSFPFSSFLFVLVSFESRFPLVLQKSPVLPFAAKL
jgi:hypothetical protein